MLPIEIRTKIFLNICRYMREIKYRNVIPYKKIKNELQNGRFYSLKRICIDNMNIIAFEMILSYELKREININYNDFMYYQLTSSRINDKHLKKCIHIYGTLKHEEIKYFVCENCRTSTIIVSHKYKKYICKNCKHIYF